MTRAPEDGAGASQRIPALDWLKALAMVAVAINHAGPYLMGPRSTAFDAIVRGGLVAFHVPTFLVVSGFLYSRQSPQSLAVVGQRLSRFLVPYLVASVLALALGFSQVRGPLDVLKHLAFGSALGIYYYIFLLAIFTGCIWPLSRMPSVWIAGLLAALCGYALASSLVPGVAVRESMYWFMRNPLHLGGYFLCGWLVAAWRTPLSAFERRWRPAVALVAVACVAAWLAALLEALPGAMRPFLRAGYTLSVVWLVVVFVPSRPVPKLVRFLSDSTLTLYLYHMMIEVRLLPYAMPLPPWLRTPVLALAGLGGSTGLLLAARALLGRTRARWLLGS